MQFKFRHENAVVLPEVQNADLLSMLNSKSHILECMHGDYYSKDIEGNVVELYSFVAFLEMLPGTRLRKNEQVSVHCP